MLRLVTVPGTLQLISTLLDVDSKQERKNKLFDTDDEKDETEGFVRGDIRCQERQGSGHHADDYQGHGQQPLQDTCNLLETQARSSQHACIIKHSSWVLTCWKQILGFWSIPQEEPLTDQDVLPALGMSILCSLAYYDEGNCMEISKAQHLVPKIIRFTCYGNDVENTNKVQQEILLESSLKLLRILSNSGGEIGITLRHTIAEHPVLLSNLTKILGGSFTSQDLRKHVVGILRNLAVDGNISQEIGRIQMVVRWLIDAFLSRAVSSSANWHPSLQKLAGQALVMLTMESADNCAAILKKSENLIGDR